MRLIFTTLTIYKYKLKEIAKLVAYALNTKQEVLFVNEMFLVLYYCSLTSKVALL